MISENLYNVLIIISTIYLVWLTAKNVDKHGYSRDNKEDFWKDD